MRDDTAQQRGARALALWMLGVGLIGALLTGLSAASWLQGGLRFGCSWAAGGTESGSASDGVWVCGDGIALLMPGIAILVLGGLAVLIAALVVLTAWHRPRELAWLVAALAVLAVAPTVVTCLALLGYASAHDAVMHDAAAAPPESRVALWQRFALPALALTVAAGALAALGVRMRAAGRAPRAAGALVIVALLLVLTSAALSMLGTLSLGLVAAGIIVAGWYLAATVAPAARERAELRASPPVADRRLANGGDRPSDYPG